MSEQKRGNLCVAIDALISTALMLVGFIFMMVIDRSLLGYLEGSIWGYVKGIASVAVPVLIVAYAFLGKKVLLTVAFGVKTIVVAATAISSFKTPIGFNGEVIAQITIAVIAVFFLVSTAFSLKNFSFKSFGIVMIILLAVGALAIGLYVFETASFAEKLQILMGKSYYVSVLLQNQSDVFLWVAMLLIAIFNGREKDGKEF